MRTFFVLFLFSSTVFAAGAPAIIKMVSEDLKKNDVRTVQREVDAKEQNSCLTEGQGHVIELQVKKVNYDRQSMSEPVYVWETIKTVTVDKDGRVIEGCDEVKP